MTVTVISPRTRPPAAVPSRINRPAGRRPGAGSGPPTLTITFDIPLAGQSPAAVAGPGLGYEHALVRTVDVHVRRLRAKVGDALPVVTTVYGVGYRLADGVRIVVEPDN